ncbi:MAG TPA: nuclear transport factor 2 family protein [Candidatus Limnocylindrales bacterium]
MHASPEIDIVLAQFDAYNDRDIEAVLRYYSRTAVVRDAGGGTFRDEGHDAIRVAFGEVFDASPELHADARDVFQVGRWVTTHSVATGFRSSGDKGKREWVEVYGVEDGLITTLDIYAA